MLSHHPFQHLYQPFLSRAVLFLTYLLCFQLLVHHLPSIKKKTCLRNCNIHRFLATFFQNLNATLKPLFTKKKSNSSLHAYRFHLGNAQRRQQKWSEQRTDEKSRQRRESNETRVYLAKHAPSHTQTVAHTHTHIHPHMLARTHTPTRTRTPTHKHVQHKHAHTTHTHA